MRHSDFPHSEAAKRRAAIVKAIRAGTTPADAAARFGVTYRYAAMLAKSAGLAKPRGRPLGATKQFNAPAPRPQRSGYALQALEGM